MPGETNINTSIAILVNPRSGKGKGINTGTWLSDQLFARNMAHELFADQWPDQLGTFSEAWVIGGDGTINYVINRYKEIQIPIVLFKGGTGDDFAWRLYGDISLEEQLELVLSADAKPVDVLSCNGQLYINSLGIGFDGEVLDSMSAIRWMGGHIGYLWVVIKKIFSYKEPTFKITAADKLFNNRYLLVIINNNTRTGGGFMVTPNALINDGLADIVLCKPLSVVKRLRYLPVIEKGKHLEKTFITFFQEKEIRIESDKPIKAALDGELIMAKVFDVKVLSEYLKFKY